MPNIFAKWRRRRRRSRSGRIFRWIRLVPCFCQSSSMSRVESEALDNIQQFVAIQRDSELQVASAFLSPLSFPPSLLSIFFSFSMFALPCWSRGTHKLICVGIGFVWICLPCGWYCLVDTFPQLPPSQQHSRHKICTGLQIF